MDSTSLAVVLAVFGLVLILLSYRRQVQHRTWSAIGHGVAGAAIFLLGALLFTVALNFNTYERSQTAQPIAQLSFEKTGAHSYRVSLMRIPSGDLQVLNLTGDQWRIEARQLVWTGWPRWLGLRSDIRLQQLLSSGVDAGKAGIATDYSLSRNPGIDLWKLRDDSPQALTAVLTLHLLSSSDIPLTDGLRYHIYLTADGLAARVINKRVESNAAPAASTAATNTPSSVHNVSAAASSPSTATAKPSVRHK